MQTSEVLLPLVVYGGRIVAPLFVLVFYEDLVHAEITFRELARQTGLGEKTLHRMLNRNGNPTARNLGLILKRIAEDLGIKPRVQVAAPQLPAAPPQSWSPVQGVPGVELPDPQARKRGAHVPSGQSFRTPHG